MGSYELVLDVMNACLRQTSRGSLLVASGRGTLSGQLRQANTPDKRKGNPNNSLKRKRLNHFDVCGSEPVGDISDTNDGKKANTGWV